VYYQKDIMRKADAEKAKGSICQEKSVAASHENV